MLIKIFSGYRREKIEEDFAAFSLSHAVTSLQLSTVADQDNRCFYTIACLYEGRAATSRHFSSTIQTLLEDLENV